MYAIGFNKLQQFISVNQSKNINQDLTKCYLSYIILVHFKCLLINKKTTSRLPSYEIFGGAYETRTHDLFNAIEAL